MSMFPGKYHPNGRLFHAEMANLQPDPTSAKCRCRRIFDGPWMLNEMSCWVCSKSHWDLKISKLVVVSEFQLERNKANQFLNGWKWLNNHFPSKDLVHPPIESTIFKWMFQVPGNNQRNLAGVCSAKKKVVSFQLLISHVCPPFPVQNSTLTTFFADGTI